MQANKTSEAISLMKVLNHTLQFTSFVFAIGLSLFAYDSLHAQQKNLPLNRELELDYEKFRNIIKIRTDSIFKGEPQIEQVTITTYSNPPSFKPYITTQYHQEKDKSKSLFIRKLKKENLFIVNDTADKFYLTIDPLSILNLEKTLTIS